MVRVRVEFYKMMLNVFKCVRYPIQQATDLCVSSYNLKYSIQYTILLWEGAHPYEKWTWSSHVKSTGKVKEIAQFRLYRDVNNTAELNGNKEISTDQCKVNVWWQRCPERNSARKHKN